ncbi:MAG: hypothetical protein SGBAC_012274 [Bacillariaceae sp.]
MEELQPADEKSTGSSRKFIALVAIVVVVLAAVGGGVGATMASKNKVESAENAVNDGAKGEDTGDENTSTPTGGSSGQVSSPSPSKRLGSPPSQNPTTTPTSSPTTATPTISPVPTVGTDGCRTKRIRITHICNVPDLDDCGDRDTEMDLKVLINDELYWPRDTRTDCVAGSYAGGCEIDDSLLINACFELRNSIEQVYHNRGESDNIMLTIYDEDLWRDDRIDTNVPNDEWYNPVDCGVQELNVTGAGGELYRLLVTSEETVPTAAPSNSPSRPPSLSPTKSPTGQPTIAPTSSPTSKCGFSDVQLTVGMDGMVDELESMNLAISSINDDLDGNRRQLLWGGLVRGVSKFTSRVIKKAGQEGPLSSLADVCTLVSSALSFGGLFGGEDEIDERQEELFAQVFQRFDAIDQKLEDITDQIERGFDELESLILETVANRILDEVIKGELAQLNDDYVAYINPEHTPATRQVYEDTFRNSCLNDHSPFTTFRQLYSHACRGCEKLEGQSNQYMLDLFVDKAIDSFDNVEARIRWFRSSFSTVMIGAMVRTIYLHSVCLYQQEGTCQNEDPVYREKLEQMGDALEEVALSLSQAEERLKCRRKRVRLTQMCDLPDLDPAIIRDDDMDLRWEINDERYWPLNIGADCVDGMGAFNSACVIPDNRLMNGACYTLSNSVQKTMDSATRLKVKLIDEDVGFDDTMTWYFNSNEWYDDATCNTFQMEQTHRDGGRIKLTIESEVRNEAWKI